MTFWILMLLAIALQAAGQVHCSKTASLIAISPFPCALNAHLELLRYPPPRPHASPPALRDGVLFYGALQMTSPALWKQL